MKRSFTNHIDLDFVRLKVCRSVNMWSTSTLDWLHSCKSNFKTPRWYGGKALPNVISNKTDNVYFVHLLFPCCLGPPEELSQNYLGKADTLCWAPLKQNFPTQQHSAPYPPPSSIISFLSFIGALSRPFINLFDYLTVFCTLSWNSSILWYRPPSQ